MRTIIILILYVVITILSLPMYLIEAIVRLISPRAAAHIAQVIVKGAFNLVMFVSGCQKDHYWRRKYSERHTGNVCRQPPKLL